MITVFYLFQKAVPDNVMSENEQLDIKSRNLLSSKFGVYYCVYPEPGLLSSCR